MRRFLQLLLMTSALAFAEPITREAIEKRLASLEEARIQQMANLNALNGAIEDCKFWLNQLAAKPDQLKPTAKPGHPPAPAKKE
jgi:uncharacterized coiled-coil protein SlyX